MSREQWGHGYYQGIKDAKNGTIGTYSEKARDCADRIFLAMNEYENLTQDRSLKTLNEVKDIFVKSKFYKKDETKIIHSAFNYIWKHSLSEGYIGGEDGRYLDYDYDVLILI